MKSLCFVVTGLPASGKSTVGRLVADKLGLALLDKDDYLERLFEERGTGDTGWRQKLSRESDDRFRRDAENRNAPILVSHWRPPGLQTQSGTPVDWLAAAFERVVEIYCPCPVEQAAQRFTRRERHPGHLDNTRSQAEVLAWMIEYSQHLPLSLGILETIGSVESMDKTIERLSGYVQNDA